MVQEIQTFAVIRFESLDVEIMCFDAPPIDVFSSGEER